MKLEVWTKDGEILVVGVHEQYECRYRFDGKSYWISGMTYYSLLSSGWTLRS